MLAAGLWAVDALLRTELTKTIPSIWIVFIEHLVGFIILSPFLIRSWGKIKTLRSGDWLKLVGLTIVSSVLASLLFTEALFRSFAQFDFATPVLLQKLQPIFVILLAAIFLKEKITFRYLVLVPIALVGSYLISFGVDPVQFHMAGKELVYLLAVGASLCWGVGTILSKSILNKLTYSEATTLRFLLAIPLSLMVGLLIKPDYSLTSLSVSEITRFIVIAFTTGAGAILIYYRGLQYTEAKISTIAELTFPIVSILIAITALNPYGSPQVLSLANIFGIIILLSAILAISLDNYQTKRGL